METAAKMRKSVWLVSGFIGLGACAHAQTARVEPPSKMPAPAVAAEQPKPADSEDARAQREAADLKRILDGTVLHFAFDEADLTAESRQRLTAIATVLRERSALAVRVAGNCDERGTEEYNLALGERRASAAKKYLVDLGIDANRIGTISYGKEHPAAPGHDERAWAENRRDEFQPTRGL